MVSPDLAQLNEIRKLGFKPGVVGLVLFEKKLLFFFKKEYGIWLFPQGSLNNNEKLEDGLARKMSEELSEEFYATCTTKNELIHIEEMEFANPKPSSGELYTDDGQEIAMKGKVYFFYKVDASLEHIDIEKTEFDDYFWLDYKGAKYITEKMNIRNKAKIIDKVLEKLKEKDYIA